MQNFDVCLLLLPVSMQKNSHFNHEKACKDKEQQSSRRTPEEISNKNRESSQDVRVLHHFNKNYPGNPF